MLSKNNSRPRFLVWDADGTLFDTYPAIIHALNLALADFDIKSSPDWLEDIARKSLGTTYQLLGETYGIDPQSMQEKSRQYYLLIPLESQPLFPGVKKICQFIIQKGGHNFIFTHRRRVTLQRLLDFHKIATFFTSAVTIDDGYPDKPDPAGLLTIITKFSLSADQTIMIGDREIDIQAGRAAGVHTCFYGKNKIDQPADIMITDYRDLLTLLEEVDGND